MQKKLKRLELVRQVKQELKKIHRRGVSRHELKRRRPPNQPTGLIVGDKTFKDYSDIWRRCLEYHRDMGQQMSKIDFQKVGKKLALNYLQDCQKKGMSAWSLKTYKSGLNSILKNKIADKDILLPVRRSQDITRGRDVRSDAYKKKYKQDILLAEATGARNTVLKRLTANDFIEKDGRLYCIHRRDKGGKTRMSPVLKSHEAYVRNFIKEAHPVGPLASHAARHDDKLATHRDRRVYAWELYQEYVAAGEKGKTFRSCGDVWYWNSVAKVSRALGHSEARVYECVRHYLKEKGKR
jgi:hypothetical protein